MIPLLALLGAVGLHRVVDADDSAFQVVTAFRTIPVGARNNITGRVNRPDDHGMIGHNAKEWLSVSEQRLIGRQLLVAMSTDNKDVVQMDVDALKKTFDMMDDQGHFPRGKSLIFDGPENYIPNFLSETTTALLALEKWDPNYKADVDAMRPKILIAANAAYPSWESVIKRAGNSANWLFRDARTWIQLGAMFNEDKFTTVGRSLLKTAYTYQKDNGILIEKGGGDTTYQAASLYHLSILYMFDPTPEAKAVLTKGLDWYLTRFTPDGQLDVSDNSRTAIGVVTRYGDNKVGNDPQSVLLTLAMAKQALPDESQKLDSLMALFYKTAFDGSRLKPRTAYMKGAKDLGKQGGGDTGGGGG